MAVSMVDPSAFIPPPGASLDKCTWRLFAHGVNYHEASLRTFQTEPKQLVDDEQLTDWRAHLAQKANDEEREEPTSSTLATRPKKRARS